MAMPVAPGASVLAGAGDLAVAAAFAGGADSEKISAAADRSDSSEVSSSEDEAEDAEGLQSRSSDKAHDKDQPEFEFSDEETRRRIPGVIRDGSDSSEWSDSSDEDVEELDLENMPKWLEDIKNNVKNDFDDDAAHVEPPRTKNEIAADKIPPPPPPPQVGADETLIPIGDVVSVVGDVVVVQSVPDFDPLDEASVLCLETRQGLGGIEEVFGPVAAPLYALRVPTAHVEMDEEVVAADAASDSKPDEKLPGVGASKGKLDVRVGMRVFAVEARQILLETKGLHTKGYDNSGLNDEEVEEDDEFSDDELEAEAKKKRKQKKRGAEGDAGEGGYVQDGGLAAAAAAAGGYSGGDGGPRAGGRGRGRGGYREVRSTQGGRGFTPKHPPAMQMAYMNVGGAGGQMGFQAPPHQQQVHMVPMNAHGQPMMAPGAHGVPQMVPMQMMHQGMMPPGQPIPGHVMMPPGMVMMPPQGFQPAPPPPNWPPGQPWPPPPPSQ